MSFDPATVKRSTVDVPILAFKNAHLVRDVHPSDIRFRFRSLAFGVVYEAEAFARCLNRRPRSEHGPPGADCSCGFYAMNKAAMVGGGGAVHLTVELSGVVFVANNGYRAQHQRVVGVEPGRKCFRCGSGRPTHFVFPINDPAHLSCPTCLTRYGTLPSFEPSFEPVETVLAQLNLAGVP